jgi:hypothetical protein
MLKMLAPRKETMKPNRQQAGAQLLERVQAEDAGDQQDDLHQVGVLPEERAALSRQRRTCSGRTARPGMRPPLG